MVSSRIMHLFPGSGGITVGLLSPVVIGVICYKNKKHDLYNFDADGSPGAFEPFLAKYLKLTETVIGLAAASIVLLVGSSAFRGQSGRLPWFYASPLFLLAFCVLWGIIFSFWMIFHYELYQHDGLHSKFHYALNETLGFSYLFCFVAGYAWLIWVVAS